MDEEIALELWVRLESLYMTVDSSHVKKRSLSKGSRRSSKIDGKRLIFKCYSCKNDGHLKGIAENKRRNWKRK